MFQAGKYETGEAATWEEGDWNGDRVFDPADFVRAFQSGYQETQNPPLAGNADRNGLFDSSDLVLVFQAGKYETGQAAQWEQCDWNGDRLFDSGDLVAAFQSGRYEQPPAALRSVFTFDTPWFRSRPLESLPIEAIDIVFAELAE